MSLYYMAHVGIIHVAKFVYGRFPLRSPCRRLYFGVDTREEEGIEKFNPPWDDVCLPNGEESMERNDRRL